MKLSKPSQRLQFRPPNLPASVLMKEVVRVWRSGMLSGYHGTLDSAQISHSSRNDKTKKQCSLEFHPINQAHSKGGQQALQMGNNDYCEILLKRCPS